MKTLVKILSRTLQRVFSISFCGAIVVMAWCSSESHAGRFHQNSQGLKMHHYDARMKEDGRRRQIKQNRTIDIPIALDPRALSSRPIVPAQKFKIPENDVEILPKKVVGGFLTLNHA